MNETITATGLPPAFPDHTQLPDEDGTFVKNFQEHPQSIILTDFDSCVAFLPQAQESKISPFFSSSIMNLCNA